MVDPPLISALIAAPANPEFPCGTAGVRIFHGSGRVSIGL
jgi:hypothetical protein